MHQFEIRQLCFFPLFLRIPFSGQPCSLFCKPKDPQYRFSAKLASKVIDGTPCRPGSIDICIDGRCQVTYGLLYNFKLNAEHKNPRFSEIINCTSKISNQNEEKQGIALASIKHVTGLSHRSPWEPILSAELLTVCARHLCIVIPTHHFPITLRLRVQLRLICNHLTVLVPFCQNQDFPQLTLCIFYN